MTRAKVTFTTIVPTVIKTFSGISAVTAGFAADVGKNMLTNGRIGQ